LVQIDIGFEDVHTQLSTIIETRQIGLFGILPLTGLEQYIFHALLIAICQVRFAKLQTTFSHLWRIIEGQ